MRRRVTSSDAARATPSSSGDAHLQAGHRRSRVGRCAAHWPSGRRPRRACGDQWLPRCLGPRALRPLRRRSVDARCRRPRAPRRSRSPAPPRHRAVEAARVAGPLAQLGERHLTRRAPLTRPSEPRPIDRSVDGSLWSRATGTGLRRVGGGGRCRSHRRWHGGPLDGGMVEMDEVLIDVAVVDDDAFLTLRSAFAGELLRSADDGYDAARRVWNGNIDRRPAVIARCRGVADVQRSLAFAVEHGLRGVGARWRAQRARLRDERRRAGRRPQPDEGHPGRPERTDSDSAGRRAVARARPGDPGIRAGDHRWHGVEHRHRRADARRRPGMADGQARADDRQPSLGRRHHRRRHVPHGRRRRGA